MASDPPWKRAFAKTDFESAQRRLSHKPNKPGGNGSGIHRFSRKERVEANLGASWKTEMRSSRDTTSVRERRMGHSPRLADAGDHHQLAPNSPGAELLRERLHLRERSAAAGETEVDVSAPRVRRRYAARRATAGRCLPAGPSRPRNRRGSGGDASIAPRTTNSRARPRRGRRTRWWRSRRRPCGRFSARARATGGTGSRAGRTSPRRAPG